MTCVCIQFFNLFGFFLFGPVDTVNVPGRPTTIGYSGRSDFDAPHLSASALSASSPTTPPAHTPSVLYNLLVNAGALVHCKTTVPPGLLALETHSDLFGVTRNPWDLARTCGVSFFVDCVALSFSFSSFPPFLFWDGGSFLSSVVRCVP